MVGFERAAIHLTRYLLLYTAEAMPSLLRKALWKSLTLFYNVVRGVLDVMTANYQSVPTQEAMDQPCNQTTRKAIKVKLKRFGVPQRLAAHFKTSMIVADLLPRFLTPLLWVVRSEPAMQVRFDADIGNFVHDTLRMPQQHCTARRARSSRLAARPTNLRVAAM